MFHKKNMKYIEMIHEVKISSQNCHSKYAQPESDVVGRLMEVTIDSAASHT